MQTTKNMKLRGQDFAEKEIQNPGYKSILVFVHFFCTIFGGIRILWSTDPIKAFTPKLDVHTLYLGVYYARLVMLAGQKALCPL